jgi:hypothetical protein
MKPAVALDVDGVLFPLAERFGGPILVPEGHVPARIAGFDVSYLPQLQTWLPGLAGRCRVMWASSWETDSLRRIEQHFGLPQLDRVDVYRHPAGRAAAVLEAVADDVPLVWCEDQRQNAAVRARLRDRPAGTLLVQPRRHVGLTGRQINRIDRFLAELAG